MVGDGRETYFLRECHSGKSLEAMAEEHPEYVRLYVTKQRDGRRTRLSLTRDTGDVLYLLSKTDRASFKGYFDILKSREPRPLRQPPEGDSSKKGIKKIKQQSLLSFFGNNKSG